MYGLPGPSEEDFPSPSGAPPLGAEHSRFYSLIFEEGTPLLPRPCRRGSVPCRKGRRNHPRYAARGRAISGRAPGYTRYKSQSCYTKEGRECTPHDLLTGAGANTWAWAAPRASNGRRVFPTPERLDCLRAGARAASIDASSRFEEQVVLGLRTREGVRKSRFTGREPVVARLINRLRPRKRTSTPPRPAPICSTR